MGTENRRRPVAFAGSTPRFRHRLGAGLSAIAGQSPPACRFGPSLHASPNALLSRAPALGFFGFSRGRQPQRNLKSVAPASMGGAHGFAFAKPAECGGVARLQSGSFDDFRFALATNSSRNRTAAAIQIVKEPPTRLVAAPTQHQRWRWRFPPRVQAAICVYFTARFRAARDFIRLQINHEARRRPGGGVIRFRPHSPTDRSGNRGRFVDCSAYSASFSVQSYLYLAMSRVWRSRPANSGAENARKWSMTPCSDPPKSSRNHL